MTALTASGSESALSGWEVCADLMNHNSFTIRFILKQEIETSRSFSWLSRPVYSPTGLINGVPVTGWDDEKYNDCCSDCVGCEKEHSVDIAIKGRGNAILANTYVNATKTRSVVFTERAAIIRHFFTYVGLPTSSLSEDVPKLRGFLRGRLWLYYGMHLRLIGG